MKRQRIGIERKTSRQNEVGEILYRWEFFCSVWAEFKGGGVVTVRYRADLSVADRVAIGNQYFEIVDVVDRHEIRLLELSIRPYERDREIVSRFGDVQQRLRAFPEPRSTQANRKS